MHDVTAIAKAQPHSLIGKAFRFAKKAHAGQKRKSSDPYFSHVVATADTLLSWNLDEVTIAAGLLHDVVEDTPVQHEELARHFGEEIAALVDGVTKLGRIKYRGAERKVESLRKLIFAISKDLRVVFIKLADRLHNMRTLNALPREKQKRIALETDEIYAAIAYRLGMHNLSGELHDLAFPYLYPKEYRWLKTAIPERYSERMRYLERIAPTVEQCLKDHRITPQQIDFRAKRYSSLYFKLLRHGMDFDKIYDLVAFRIIVRSVEECYAALGAIHQSWPPLPGRIKDYIASPKPNNYRSLHTTVIGPEGKIVEFQIRTKEMHEENEYGIAAHWIYKQQQKKGKRNTVPSAEEITWIQQLKQWYEQYSLNPEHALHAMKIDFFKGRIFALTPKGDVVDLPEGATPVDFAYRIHTEIGNGCVGAKVNGTFVPLNYRLQSGDLVEIIAQKNKLPSQDWLRFVKTSLARDHIKAALRKKRGSLYLKKPSKTEFLIVAEDRVGLIKDITTAIARSHVNIIQFRTQSQAGNKFPIDKVQCDLTDRKKIEKLVLKIKKIDGVKEVRYRIL
ncbi:RelA/SpoT family protein [Candidatus Parcubacteria bacterium]|nr:MAG: RelA/SpoT family protein [Candidatus Parcubacteria bacterium]